MAKLSKKMAIATKKVDSAKLYDLVEAMKLVKEVNVTKFDSSVDLHIRLGVDPRKADQAIRGTVSLPHGTGKTNNSGEGSHKDVPNGYRSSECPSLHHDGH